MRGSSFRITTSRFLYLTLPYFAIFMLLGTIVAAVLHHRFDAPLLAGLTGISALLVGALQLQRTARTQQMDFLFKLHESLFFKEDMARIRDAIDEEQVWIHIEARTPEDPAYNPPRPRGEADVVIRADSLDDYLGYLELVALFLEADMLVIDMAWEMFAHYVETALRDPNIRYYIRWINEYPGHTRLYYTRLDPLRDEFERYARRKKLFKEPREQTHMPESDVRE